MIFRTWAVKWNIPIDAILDLEKLVGVAIAPALVEPGASETRVQSQVRIEAAEKGHILMRNNVGALQDKRGVPVRYGLMNDSKEMNAVVKSADLIGIRSVLITPEMVGHTIGQFMSVEVKEAAWTWSGNAHEQAQLAWANYVNSRGGYAIFANAPGYL